MLSQKQGDGHVHPITYASIAFTVYSSPALAEEQLVFFLLGGGGGGGEANTSNTPVIQQHMATLLAIAIGCECGRRGVYCYHQKAENFALSVLQQLIFTIFEAGLMCKPSMTLPVYLQGLALSNCSLGGGGL